MLKLSQTLDFGKFVNPKHKAMGIASRNVITCTENERIRSLINIMLGLGIPGRGGYRRIPVIDKRDNSLRGIVTTTDMLDFLGAGPKYELFVLRSGLDSKVRKIMTPDVHSLDKNNSIANALNTFKKNRRGAYPILHENRVLGILSEHNLIKQINKKTGIKVGDLMVKKPMIAKEEQPVLDIARMMCRGGFRRLPVVSNGILTGIVTPYDILNNLSRNNKLSKLKYETRPIKDIMNVGVASVNPEADIYRAIDIMHRKRIGGLPVTVEDELIGIITERDIVDTLHL